MDVQKLHAPFPVGAHSFRIMKKSQDKKSALCYTYVDARDVQARLSEVDPEWQSAFRVLEMNAEICAVECTLTVGGVSRVDVGVDNRNVNRSGEFTDNEGNYIKGAYSDALKRAAVNFGVGAYLYKLRMPWVDLDERENISQSGAAKIRQSLESDLKRLFGKKVPPALGDEDKQAFDDGWPPAVDATAVENDVNFGGGDGDEPGLNPDDFTGMTKGDVSLINQCREYHQTSDGVCSESQYNLLSGKLDYITAKGGHNDVLHVLTGRLTTKENRVGRTLASKILDAINPKVKNKDTGKYDLDNPDYRQDVVDALKHIYTVITAR